MKIPFKLPKITKLLLVVFLLSTGISCKDQKGQKDLKKQMDQMEDGDSFAGSSKRDDICQLFTEKDIRSAFDLSDTIKVKQEKTRNVICSYEWETLGKNYMVYNVSLNFARGGKRTKSQIDKAWESQNKSVYKKHKPQNVSGVGDRASWSDLGGGQLRVASDGYIFYMSFFLIPKNHNPMDTQEMIAKASTLTKQVIERM